MESNAVSGSDDVLSCCWCGRRRNQFKIKVDIIVKYNYAEMINGPIVCSEFCGYMYQKTFYPQCLHIFKAIYPDAEQEALMFGLHTNPDMMYPHNSKGLDIYTDKKQKCAYRQTYWMKPSYNGRKVYQGHLEKKEFKSFTPRSMYTLGIDKRVVTRKARKK